MSRFFGIISLCISTIFLPSLDAGFVPFEDCGSIFELESIEVAGCSAYPCNLEIGSTVKVTTNLMIRGKSLNTKELIQNVYFVVSRVLLEVQVSPDPCTTTLRGTNYTICNLTIGQRVAYEANLTVGGVPPLPATLFWTIRNKASDEMVICYRTAVRLTRN